MQIKLRSKISLLFMAFAMLLALPAVALADLVKNEVTNGTGGKREVTLGQSTSVNYWIHSTGKVCDAADNSAATVFLKVSAWPAGGAASDIGISPASQSFNACDVSKSFTFSTANAKVGNYTIAVDRVEDATAPDSYVFNDATFTLQVNAAPVEPPVTNTAPQVSLTGVENGASYEKGSVPNATCSVVDAEDGNSSFAASLSGNLDANGYGSQTATCSYIDQGGLKAGPVSATYSITESQAPTSQHSMADANANGWHKEDVTVNLSASDNAGGSGVKEIRYSINGGAEQVAAGASKAILVDSEGTTTISYYAVDNFGNAESPANTATVKLDKTAPTIVNVGVSVGTLGSNGWYTSQVTNEFRAADGLSGFAGKADPHSILKVSGTQEGSSIVLNSGTVTDRAGNVSNSADSAALKIDLSVPVVNITNAPAAGATVNLCDPAGLPSPNYTAQDAISGIASEDGRFTTQPNQGGSGVGAYTYKAEATDFAGHYNSAFLSYKVVYGGAFSGVTQPINGGLTPSLTAAYDSANPGAFGDDSSRFKLGSTVPVKFRMMCGTTPVDNAVAKLNVKRADAIPDPGVDEAVSTAASTTGNLFRYDATSGQYIFNLSTKSGYTNPSGTTVSFAAGTYTLSIMLDDGSHRSVNINIVK